MSIGPPPARDSESPSSDYVPRTGSRWIRVTLLILIPVLVLVGGGLWLWTHRPEPDTRQADAQAAVDSYLAAWSQADYAGMAAQANVPAAAVMSIMGMARRSSTGYDDRHRE